MHSVLVVDDEPLVRLSLASLRPWSDDGFDFPAEAANGAEALLALAARPEIDLVLLDLTMPVMDGLEFLRRLPAEPARRPAVVVLSAHDDYHLVREAFRLGASDYLLKSEMDGASLRAALDKAAAGVAQSRERDQAIVQRRHLEALKAQVLRDVLAGPASPEVEETLQELGVGLSPPFHVCGFWVEDLPAVAEREQAEGLGRFSELLVRSLGQVLARFGGGEVVSLGPGHAAVIHSAGEARRGGEEADARAFARDAAEYAGRYLSVKVTSAVGTACGALREASASYQAARSTRTVVSRIVVLAKRAMRERFADPEFSLEEAAQRAGVSKNHLSFEFSRETGQTFTEHLAQLRVEEAKRLLSTTGLMVYEVGERVGYPSVEHFSRVFKKLVGVSPVRFKAGLEKG